MSFNIVLVEPEIPQNTGNIARTCAATGASLHLVEPMGFKIDDKQLKRAGLDYWHLLDIKYYTDINDFLNKNKGARMFFATTKARYAYSDIEYQDGDFLVFGKETKGLDEKLLLDNPQTCIRIPMIEGARSLNLANSVAVVLYEALRQSEFAGLLGEGQLHNHSW